MHPIAKIPGLVSPFSPIDSLLADIAIRVQLSATNHKLAEDRYHAVGNYIERTGSPLNGFVELFYPQGSMAIDATIASRLRTDEFDIDVIVQLALPHSTPPGKVLDLLYESIRGAPGSQYYKMTSRRTRCVTVTYADGMHLDFTPAVLLSGQPEKTSVIFHQRPEEPNNPGCHVIANPYGFAEWFLQKTPIDHDFAKSFQDRSFAFDALKYAADAEHAPVRAKKDAHEKSKAVIALQLLKRWRNVQYDSRQGQRRPPSIMMAKLVADSANRTTSLYDELIHQAVAMREFVNVFHLRGALIEVKNPKCNQDLFTDRWPASLAEQNVFLDDLNELVAKLVLLPKTSPNEMKVILSGLFGEGPTVAVLDAHFESLGKAIRSGNAAHRPGTGSVLGVASGIVPAGAALTRKHTFYGSTDE